MSNRKIAILCILALVYIMIPTTIGLALIGANIYAMFYGKKLPMPSMKEIIKNALYNVGIIGGLSFISFILGNSVSIIVVALLMVTTFIERMYRSYKA